MARLSSGWFYWPACILGCGLVTLVVMGPEAKRRIAIERQCATMEAEVGRLAEARDQLEAARQALQSDPDYMERIARHELGLAQPGEVRLPQPVSLSLERPDEPPAPEPRLVGVAPVLVLVARFAEPPVPWIALSLGGALLAAAVFLSIPTARFRPARD